MCPTRTCYVLGVCPRAYMLVLVGLGTYTMGMHVHKYIWPRGAQHHGQQAPRLVPLHVCPLSCPVDSVAGLPVAQIGATKGR